jgi:uncharacterized FAD-dependent dehydrogenase
MDMSNHTDVAPRSSFDVAIIGSGPAGLAAAVRLAGEKCSTVVLDTGRAVGQRSRTDPADMTQGHGGAGLFSDGKFSFFPSASELWSLPRYRDLRAAYDWTCHVLAGAGLDTPPFPDDPTDYSMGSGEWVLKDYPSDYLSLQARMDLTQQLVDDSGADMRTDTAVTSIRYVPEVDSFIVDVMSGDGPYVVTAERIILATGRFGPLNLAGLIATKSWRRLEVGFRIEQSAHRSFFSDMKQLDPKLKMRRPDNAVEWRTFCACRNGEAVLTETAGVWSASGRADCPPTGRSNIGFNTRILDESLAERAAPGIVEAMAYRHHAFRISLVDVLAGDRTAVSALDLVYGSEVRRLMVEGVEHLATRYPVLTDHDTVLIGPTLEGVGWYPKVTGDLQSVDVPAYVVGDACGLFRGIVAAMISGHYGAGAAARALSNRQVAAHV